MYQNIINDWKCWDRTCPSGTRRDSHRLDDGCRGYYGIREMVQDLIWLSANDIWLQFTLQISTVSKHRLGNFNMATLITRSRTWKTSSLSLCLSPTWDIVIYSNWVRFKNNVNKYDKIFKNPRRSNLGRNHHRSICTKENKMSDERTSGPSQGHRFINQDVTDTGRVKLNFLTYIYPIKNVFIEPIWIPSTLNNIVPVNGSSSAK